MNVGHIRGRHAWKNEKSAALWDFGLLQKKNQIKLALSVTHQMLVYGFQVKYIMTGMMTTMRHCFLHTKKRSMKQEGPPFFRAIDQTWETCVKIMRWPTILDVSFPFVPLVCWNCNQTYRSCYSYKTQNPNIKQQNPLKKHIIK